MNSKHSESVYNNLQMVSSVLPSPSAGNGTQSSILVVDDEPRILRFLRLSLGSFGFNVITASNGEDALKLITELKPQVIILDVFMSGIDGFSVLRKIRELEFTCVIPHIPVIVISARNSIAKQAFSLGATVFLSKPFLPEELVEIIRNLIGS